jgi:hypothetical protein
MSIAEILASIFGFQEGETEHGPLLHWPPVDAEIAAGQVGDDLLDLAGEIAEATGRPVAGFLADVGAVPATGRLSACLRVDRP